MTAVILLAISGVLFVGVIVMREWYERLFWKYVKENYDMLRETGLDEMVYPPTFEEFCQSLYDPNNRADRRRAQEMTGIKPGNKIGQFIDVAEGWLVPRRVGRIAALSLLIALLGVGCLVVTIVMLTF